MPKRSDYSVPAKMQPKVEAIVGLTDAFCEEHLTQDFADLCHRLAAKLARKRPSPLSSGRPKSWAAGILYTIARVNFLFDKSEKPYMPASELCRLMGVSQGTASGKATKIMRMLKIGPLDPEWMLPELRDRHPMRLVMTQDGLIVSMARMPDSLLEQLRRMGIDIEHLDD